MTIVLRRHGPAHTATLGCGLCRIGLATIVGVFGFSGPHVGVRVVFLGEP